MAALGALLLLGLLGTQVIFLRAQLHHIQSQDRRIGLLLHSAEPVLQPAPPLLRRLNGALTAAQHDRRLSTVLNSTLAFLQAARDTNLVLTLSSVARAAVPTLNAAKPALRALTPVLNDAGPALRALTPFLSAATPFLSAAAPVLEQATPALAAVPRLRTLAERGAHTATDTLRILMRSLRVQSRTAAQTKASLSVQRQTLDLLRQSLQIQQQLLAETRTIDRKIP